MVVKGEVETFRQFICNIQLVNIFVLCSTVGLAKHDKYGAIRVQTNDVVLGSCCSFLIGGEKNHLRSNPDTTSRQIFLKQNLVTSN